MPFSPTFRKNLKVALFIGLSLFIIMFTFYFYQVFYNPNLAIRQDKGIIYIPENASIVQVVDTLNRYSYLEDVVSFMLVSKLLGYHENVKPGRYELKKRMTNLEAIRLLRSGAQSPVRVTFNNVRLKEDLARKVTASITATPDEVLSLMNDSEFVSDFGFDTTTIVTMFLPNTYEMYWTTSARKLFDRMKREYEVFWGEKRRQRAEELGMTPVEVSVLASIVQAETRMGDEKQRVAGLYMNRLQKGMPLEADPTVVFAIGDFGKRRILKKDLQFDSPYNTYLNKGLPPGPINLPNPASINAVLNYEDHDYLFMCAKEDFSGYHRFASSYRQHINNARRYQQALNRSGIYR